MKTFEESIRDLCGKLADTLIAKNADYGNAFDWCPYLVPDISSFKALNVRLSDKINRLRNLLPDMHVARCEPIKDTYLDLAGYSILALNILERNEIHEHAEEELIQNE